MMFLKLALMLLASEASLVDRVVAVVDGRAILASDLMGASDSQAAIEQLIDKQLLQAEARRRGISVDDKALDMAIEQVRERNNIADLTTLKKAVIASGRSWQKYREEMREQLLERQIMSAIMAQGTQVTDRELKLAISRDPGLVERRLTRHLLLRLQPGAQDWEVQDALLRCKALLERIDGGEEFVALAKTNSEDPSAGQGGNLGWINRGMTDPVFEAATFSAELGDVVGPVRSAFGFHLIRVDKISRDITGDAQRDQLRGLLRQRNAKNALHQTLQAARRRALVKILP
jgi:parvulin-like peptidyl-prolyl isomerase